MSYKIESAEETTIVCVENAFGNSYERRGEDNWYIWQGESLEPCSDSHLIEAEYQQFLRDRK